MVKSFLELRIGDKVTYTGDGLYEDLVPGRDYYVCNKSTNPEIGVYLSYCASKPFPYIAFVTVEEYIESKESADKDYKELVGLFKEEAEAARRFYQGEIDKLKNELEELRSYYKKELEDQEYKILKKVCYKEEGKND